MIESEASEARYQEAIALASTSPRPTATASSRRRAGLHHAPTVPSPLAHDIQADSGPSTSTAVSDQSTPATPTSPPRLLTTSTLSASVQSNSEGMFFVIMSCSPQFDMATIGSTRINVDSEDDAYLAGPEDRLSDSSPASTPRRPSAKALGKRKAPAPETQGSPSKSLGKRKAVGSSTIPSLVLT